MTDWDHNRKFRYTKDAPPAEWPDRIRGISQEGLALLGINPKTNTLHWDGQELAIEKRLANFERGMALVVTIATVVVACVEVGRAVGWFEQ
ncbi:hypothetical protein [Mesorhizobium ventifaucium]|uniref:Uncharacterized protein n=1 Tax=Mesorhizobium ventifaucium TaxID=666020 RepID=A0ABM9DX67_9HYPH|nr:hypothetical protein [Mesorhizobium ventifaucium]CAH2401340.1 conserved hypothetical protein [Mesorhizobium ventifaucium]